MEPQRVELKKTYHECKMCEETAMVCDTIPDCGKCIKQTGTWVDTVSSIVGGTKSNSNHG